MQRRCRFRRAARGGNGKHDLEIAHVKSRAAMGRSAAGSGW
jgi:hypothetical protein